MLYAHEVIDLMAAYPGRDWRMVEVIRYVARGRELQLREREAIRKAVRRALEALSDAGMVLVRPPSKRRGGYACYRWKSGT